MACPRRTRRPLRLAGLVAAVAALAPGAAGAAPPAGAAQRVIVRLEAHEAGARRLAALPTVATAKARSLPLAGVVSVEVPAGTSAKAYAARLASTPGVRWAEADLPVRASRLPNDPLLGQLWSPAAIGAPAAWDVTVGAPGVPIAIVDTGVDPRHADLRENLWRNAGETGTGRETNGVDDDGNGFVDDWRGWDWIGDDNGPDDENGHGTHVAGTAGARGDNGVGIAGVSWASRLIPLRVLDRGGAGTMSDVAVAFRYASAAGARVVNASLGGDGESRAVSEAIAAAPNTLFVLAAGNDGRDLDARPSYPCVSPAPNVLCVAATSAADALAPFSNRGATTVDLGAPGVEITSTWPGGYSAASGTSMAAPHVAGAAALLFAARPSLTAAAAAEILVASARPVPSLAGATLAGGRLDVARALERVRLAPVAAAVSASAVTRSSAMVTGHVDSGGLETEVVVEYGRTGVFGQRTPPRSLAAGASGPVAFELSGLSAGMTYHVRLVATNAGGSSYGPPARLVTSPGAARPVATTGAAVVGRAGRVTLRATVAGGQGGGAYAFEFGTTRRYGRRTAWLPLPAAGRATPVRVSLGGLRPGTRLHYRVVVRAGARRVLGANRTLRIPSARLR